MYAGLDGSLGYIVPVDEKPYRRLAMLAGRMGLQCLPVAGLNPKAFRYGSEWDGGVLVWEGMRQRRLGMGRNETISSLVRCRESWLLCLSLLMIYIRMPVDALTITCK